MRGGDIAASVPRVALVAVEAIAAIDPDDRRRAAAHRRLRRWDRLARLYEFDPLSRGRMWRAGQRLGLRFDAVLFGETEDFAEALQAHMDLQSMPIVTTWVYRDRAHLVSKLASRPDVYGVIDDPTHGLAYGGRFMTWEEVQ